MEKVQLKPLIHRRQEWIGIYYTPSNTINGLLKLKTVARWTQTHKCRYVPLTKADYNNIFFELEGKTELVIQELQRYLEARNSFLWIGHCTKPHTLGVIICNV